MGSEILLVVVFVNIMKVQISLEVQLVALEDNPRNIHLDLDIPTEELLFKKHIIIRLKTLTHAYIS